MLFVVTRGIGLLAGEPSADDDVYRYLWDGARLWSHGDPYAGAPLAYFSQPLPDDVSWLADRVNHPELATVYGPVWVIIGALGWLLSPTSLFGWKVVAIGFELLLLLAVWRGFDARVVVAWVTCPLWFWEIHLQCHAELFAVGLWLFSLFAIKRGQFFRAGVLLLLALGGRWSMLVPVAIALCVCRCEPVARFRLLLGTGVGAGMLCFMLWAMAPFDLTGLTALSQRWVFNPIVWKWFPQQPSMVWVGILGLLLMLHERPWRYRIENLEIWTSLFAVWLLVSPVINPWYLLWLVPGVIVEQSLKWWSVWLAVIPIAYLQAQWVGQLDHPLGLHHHPDLVWWVQALAMIGVGVLGLLRGDRVLRVDS